MNDLISKQAAVEAIENCEPGEELFVIKSLPSAQPEIIMCKDCKHWDGKKNGGFCEVWDKYISNNAFFCGSAERRTDR